MIFIHDHKFIEKDGGFYTSGSLTNEAFERYLNIFESVEVLANVVKHSDKNDQFVHVKNKVSNIKFDLIGIKNSPAKIIGILKLIKEKVVANEHIVVRMPGFYSLIAIYYAAKMKKKFIVEVVGCPWDAFWNHSIKGKIIAPFMWYMTKRSVKKAPYVIYVTNRFLQKRYPTKGKNIGCSDVALPPIRDEILSKRLNKISNTDKNQPVKIGTSAAVNVKYKGQEYVIKAISKLNKDGYNFEYYLAGGGDNTYLRSIAEQYHVIDKVKFLGSLPHEEIFNYLDNLDIYIQPSKQEGLPRALVEAMSRGCPALGSATGGIPELLNPEFIFGNGDVNEIAGLLTRFDDETLIREAKRSFKKSQEYDKELLDEKRSSFYTSYLLDST